MIIDDVTQQKATPSHEKRKLNFRAIWPTLTRGTIGCLHANLITSVSYKCPIGKRHLERQDCIAASTVKHLQRPPSVRRVDADDIDTRTMARLQAAHHGQKKDPLMLCYFNERIGQLHGLGRWHPHSPFSQHPHCSRRTRDVQPPAMSDRRQRHKNTVDTVTSVFIKVRHLLTDRLLVWHSSRFAFATNAGNGCVRELHCCCDTTILRSNIITAYI